MMRSVIALALLLFAVSAAGEPAYWVLVDTQRNLAEVRLGDRTVEAFRGISYGRGGVSNVHFEGDLTTPRGNFRIVNVDRDTDFYVFLGLDYPTMDHLDQAHRQGDIDDATYSRILDEGFRRGRLPPDTPLGGHIGLHGVGEADETIHNRLNWTEGCVAITDGQMDRLLRYVDVGTRVVIR